MRCFMLFLFVSFEVGQELLGVFEDVYGVRLSPLQYEVEWKMRTAKSTFLG